MYNCGAECVDQMGCRCLAAPTSITLAEQNHKRVIILMNKPQMQMDLSACCHWVKRTGVYSYKFHWELVGSRVIFSYSLSTNIF